MHNDLGKHRKTYKKQALLEVNCPENPIELFQQWFLAANESEMIDEANAMTLSTIGLDGFPKNRVVLLKKYTWEGFIFYSNYASEKGKALLKNNRVSLSFFWAGLEQQIIIKGTAKKIAKNLSDGYFESRPTGSQLGAWASEQSTVVENRTFLDEKLQTLEKQYEGKEIPRPAHWGGYLIEPVSLEFWQGRPNRMHDRIRYTLTKDFSWKIERLAP